MPDQPFLMIILCIIYNEQCCGGGCGEAYPNITHSVHDDGNCNCDECNSDEYHDTHTVKPGQYVLVSKNKRIGDSCCLAVGYLKNYDIVVYATKEEAECAKKEKDAIWATTDIKEVIYNHDVYSFSDLENMETF